MPFLIIVAGVVLIVAAFNNTHTDLATALQKDLEGFFRWGIAIAAILGLGFIPGFKTPTRLLLLLVITVIVLKNYAAIIGGFTDFTKTAAEQTGEGTPAPVPTSGFAADPTTNQLPTVQQIAGSSEDAVPHSPDLIEASARDFLNPGSYVTAALEGFGAHAIFGG